jgi:N-acyl homoserine lactone hydrolase
VLACDAADLLANITERRRCGWTASPELETAAQQAIERLHRLARTIGVEVWPGHDPSWWTSGLYPSC